MAIKLQAKTNNGQVVSFELQPNDTLGSLSETLHKLTNIPQTQQKIIHKGKVLPLFGSIEASGIHDGDSMIVLVRRNIPEPTQPDNTPEPDAAAIKKAVAQSRGVDEKDLDEEEEEPEFRSQLQDLVNSLFGNFAFPQRGVPAAAPLPVNTNPPPEAIAQLTDMGFSEAQARRALILNRMSIPLATDWLLEHGEEEEQQQPPADGAAPASSPPLSSSSSSSPPSTSTPPSSSPPPLQSSSPPPLPSFSSSAVGEVVGAGGQVPIPIVGRAANEDGLTAEQRLLEMGFPSEEVTRALRATGNNYELACAMLLGEADEDDRGLDEDSPIVRAIFSNPVVGAGLANPRVMQAFRAMVDNPATVANYISDPEVGPLILQVHAILQGLIPSGAQGAAPNNSP